MSRPAAGRFAFLVHPLAPFHRLFMSVRRVHLPMLGDVLGTRHGEIGIDAVGVTARIRLDTTVGTAEGVIVAVPDLVDRLVQDQNRALALEERAARIAIAEGAQVIGLGNALAVVAGRGKELADRVPIPVTTGQAATAWACAEITRSVLADRGIERGPVGLIGFAGTVGDAVAARLRTGGVEVRVDVDGAAARRRAEALGCRVDELDAILTDCRVLVGTSTTGPVLDPSRLKPDTTLVDLALPPTLSKGPVPSGFHKVKGEAVALPGRIHGKFWGRIWLGLAGYGHGCVYACLAEPAAMAVTGEGSFSTGRRLDPERVEAVGHVLRHLGFRPVVRSS